MIIRAEAALPCASPFPLCAPRDRPAKQALVEQKMLEMPAMIAKYREARRSDQPRPVFAGATPSLSGLHT